MRRAAVALVVALGLAGCSTDPSDKFGCYQSIGPGVTEAAVPECPEGMEYD